MKKLNNPKKEVISHLDTEKSKIQANLKALKQQEREMTKANALLEPTFAEVNRLLEQKKETEENI